MDILLGRRYVLGCFAVYGATRIINLLQNIWKLGCRYFRANWIHKTGTAARRIPEHANWWTTSQPAREKAKSAARNLHQKVMKGQEHLGL
jgi:hypothetical protein